MSTSLEQSHSIAYAVAQRLERGETPTMQRIRECRDSWNHPLEWVTLNNQIRYMVERFTPDQIRRMADQLLRVTS